MMSETTKWAAPLALTCGLLVGLCVSWPSYTSAEGTERDPSQNQTQTENAEFVLGGRGVACQL